MDYLITVGILGGINIIAAMGLAILTGYTGLFSLGHAAFMAVGGYSSALLFMKLNVPFILAVILGGFFAGMVSLLIGIPTFRSQLTGDYFAIATFGFAEAIRLILNKWAYVGGAEGMPGIPRLSNVWIVMGFTIVLAFLANNFTRSQHGRNCVSIKQDEVAAQMMGVNVFKTKLMSLFISAVYCGIAGGLLGFYFSYLIPALFGSARSSDMLASIVFGGMESLIGPIITSFLLFAIPQLLYVLDKYRLIVYGLLFVVMMIFRPQGLLGYREMSMENLKKLLSSCANRLKRQGSAADKGEQ